MSSNCLFNILFTPTTRNYPRSTYWACDHRIPTPPQQGPILLKTYPYHDVICTVQKYAVNTKNVAKVLLVVFKVSFTGTKRVSWRHQMDTFSASLAICKRPPVDSPHNDQWRGVLMFSLICAWTNRWANNRDAGDFRCHRVHYDVTVTDYTFSPLLFNWHWDSHIFGVNGPVLVKQSRERWIMMTSSNGNVFRVTGHLCGESTGPRWIPRTRASDAELWCFLWSASE